MAEEIEKTYILTEHKITMGEQISDTVASIMGSWKFIIIQSSILIIWIILNVTTIIVDWQLPFKQWDVYPFILLNLALSFQAAYAAPFIMMSQNRQQNIDRHKADNDYKINIKAELEIEELHEKLDRLKNNDIKESHRIILSLEEEVKKLTEIIKELAIKNK